MIKFKNISKVLSLAVLLSSVFSQGSRDVSTSTVDAYAFRADGDNHTVIRLSVNVISSDLNYADGIRFNFGPSNTVLNAFLENDMGVQPAIVFQSGEVMFGDSSNGVFNGEGMFADNNVYDFIVHLDGQSVAPINIEYTIYDDGWAQDFCVNDNNCELCNDYGWGVDCEGNDLTVALNAEGTVTIDNIEIIQPPNQNPHIISLNDIVNDQGKQMMLSWVPGDLDNLPYFTEFSLYRYNPDTSDYVTSGDGVFYGEYFSSPGTDVSPDFGELILTREDSLININFDQNPLPVVNDFQVRWTGNIYAPTDGMYNFRTHSDDGIRLFINGIAVIDEWYDYTPTSHVDSIELSEGHHTIILEYYKNSGGAMCQLFWTIPGQDEAVVRPSGNNLMVSDLGNWDYLNSIPWVGNEPYASLVNTLEDKIPTAFKVVAHTEDPNLFFHSDYLTGRSYDNIAPPAPLGLTATVENNMVSLSWNPVSVPDFDYYRVHRATDSLFQPNFSNFVGFSATPNYIDDNAPNNEPLYYKVSATDMGGNLGFGSESAYAYIAVNRPPQVFDVALAPAVPIDTDDITVSYNYFDPDGDSEQNTEINWFKNGAITNYVGLVLPAAATSCGDEWYAEVKPGDGELLGDIISSNVVTICGGNSAPVWSSDIPMIHIDEDSEGNRISMAGLVTDSEQAISQLILTVEGNTNDEVLLASFQGSQLVLSTLTDDFNGVNVSTLTLRASDGTESSDAFVDVSIDPVNDKPVIVSYNGDYAFNEDEGYTFEIYDFTIADPDDDIVNMELNILPGENYVKSFENPGLINTPPNYNGQINVNVEVTDQLGLADSYAVLMIVNPVNDPSFLITEGSDIIENGPAIEEGSYSLTLSWKDPDGTGEVNVYEASLGGPASDWLEVSNTYSSGSGVNLVYNAVLIGTPDDQNLGQNDLSFSVIDRSEGQDESFTEYYYIPINSVNDAPSIEAYNGPIDIHEDESLMLSSSNFVVSDPDNSPIDMSLTLSSGSNYAVGSDFKTIIPDPNYNGPLSVKALISDGEKNDSINIDFNVIAVNDPVMIATVQDGQATEEAPFSMSITWTDIDASGVDGYESFISGSATNWITQSSIVEDQGTYSVTLSGTPDDENLYQNDISIKIVDKSEGVPTEKNIFFSITIDAVNDAPVVVSYNGPGEINEEQIFLLSINDLVVDDVDNDFPFDFSVTTDAGENYTIQSDAKSIRPVDNFVGTLNINYYLRDGQTGVFFSVPLTVLPINDAPQITRYNGAGSIPEDSDISFSTVDFAISDPDGSDQTFSVFLVEGDNYSLNSNGVGLTPDLDYNGALSVGVVAQDQDGASSEVFQFDLNVNAVNDKPALKDVAVDPAVPQLDDPLIVSYIVDDVDGDDVSVVIFWYKNDTLQTALSGTSSATVPASATACGETWHAVLKPNDGTLDGDSYTSNSVVTCGDNTAPVWSWTEPVLVDEDGSVEVDLYSKMYDAEHAPSQIFYSLITNTDSVKVSASISGQFLTLIASQLNFNGDAASQITINADDGGYQVPVTFSVNITPVNDAPVSINDSYILDEGGTVVSDVDSGILSNDVDVDGDDLQIIIIDEPMYGSLTINTDQSFSYVHDGSETTSDMFTYVASDGELSSSTAEVQISVTPVNDAPVIVYAASFETLEDTSFDIVVNDFVVEDPDSDPSNFILNVYSGDNYSAEQAPGGYTITPAANFSGQLIIPVSVSDGTDSSAVFDVTASVIGGNDAPEIVSGLADIIVDEDSNPLHFSLYGSGTESYFSDNDGDQLVFESFTVGSDLLMPMVVNDTLHLEFFPDAFGEDSLFIVGIDPSGESVTDTVVVSVTTVNDAPVITTAAYFVIEEEDSFDVSINDFVYYDIDSDENSLTLNLQDGDGYSIQTIDAGYRVTADENISDTLYVPSTISDGDSISNVWNLMVIVLPSNDPPIVVTAGTDIEVNEDADDIEINLTGSLDSPYFYDGDGDTLSFDAYTIGSGAVSIEIISNVLSISFNPNMFGEDSVFIIATDPSGDSVSDTIIVTVNSVDDSPQIVDAPSFETLEDDSLDIFIYNFVIRDTDTNPESISLNIVAADDTAQVVNYYTINTIEYGYRVVPFENFFGDIPLIVTAFDGSTYSDPYNISLYVVPVNDDPEIINPLADISVDEDSEPIVISLSGTETEPYFIDVDGDSIDFEIMTLNENILGYSIDGYELEVTPMLNMYGVDTLRIEGTDGSGVFVTDTVVVVVNAVNDAPGSFSLVTPEDSAEVIITSESVANGATIDVSWTISEDIEGDTIAYGFLLFNGAYSVETPAIYSADVDLTELMIPHSAVIPLLETVGFQSLSCDWMVFATDGQDTTMSDDIRTLFIDARPVLSVDESMVPEVFALHQNYPNPFNPITTINYDIPESQVVTIMIYDIMGREVRSLVNEFQEVGFRSVRWDATDNLGKGVSAGMYVYAIQAGDFRQVRKMVLLK